MSDGQVKVTTGTGCTLTLTLTHIYTNPHLGKSGVTAVEPPDCMTFDRLSTRDAELDGPFDQPLDHGEDVDTVHALQ